MRVSKYDPALLPFREITDAPSAQPTYAPIYICRLACNFLTKFLVDFDNQLDYHFWTKERRYPVKIWLYCVSGRYLAVCYDT